MQAAFYVKQGPAREVLQVGAQPTPEPGPGEVRVHLKTSGVNPSDWDACLAELRGPPKQPADPHGGPMLAIG